jgi:hypothetical protein
LKYVPVAAGVEIIWRKASSETMRFTSTQDLGIALPVEAQAKSTVD